MSFCTFFCTLTRPLMSTTSWMSFLCPIVLLSLFPWTQRTSGTPRRRILSRPSQSPGLSTGDWSPDVSHGGNKTRYCICCHQFSARPTLRHWNGVTCYSRLALLALTRFCPSYIGSAGRASAYPSFFGCCTYIRCSYAAFHSWLLRRLVNELQDFPEINRGLCYCRH